MKSKEIGYAVVFGSLYVVLGIVLQPLSFGFIQSRVACALIPLIALFGMPGVLGITVGHIIFNTFFASLGPFDLLSPFVFLIPRILIAKYGVKAMPIHTVTVAIYVAWLLNMYLPFHPAIGLSILTVGIGELFAEWYLGYVLLYPRVEQRI